MRKKSGIIKRALSLLLIFLLSINSFAAITDNDGSAFITKAEFDALRSSFQSQIDTYNQEIDSKIDAAISAYLSGINVKSEVTQTSLLNKADAPFCNGWSFPRTNLGTLFKGWVYVGGMQSGIDAASKPLETEWKVSNNNGSTGTWTTYGTAGDLDALLMVDDIEIDGGIYLKPTKYIFSTPKSGLQVAGWDEAGTVVIGTPACNNPSATTFAYSKEQFGQDDASWSITMGGTGGYSKTYNGFFIVDKEDTVGKNTEYFEKMAGGKYTTYTNNYCVYNKDENMVSYSVKTDGTRDKCAAWTTFNPSVGWAWTRYKTGYSAGTTVSVKYVGTNTNNPLGATEFALINVPVYRHHATSKATSLMVNGTISERLDMVIRYYSGLPIFQASGNGEVTVKAKFVNTDSSSTSFHIKASQFGNDDITPGTSGLEDVNISSFVVNNGATVTWKWKAKKGEQYWIKASPSSGETTITTEEIILKEEK